MRGDERGRVTPIYHYGWNIVGACVLAQMGALGLAINCLTLFLTGWSAEFGVPVSTLSFAVLTFTLATAALAPFLGILVDRFSTRWIVTGALAGMVVFHVAVSQATSAWQIILLYSLLLPVTLSLAASLPCQALVSRWFRRKRGLALGITAFGIAAAGAVLPPLIAILLPEWGWRGVWLLFAGFVGVIIIPIVFLVIRDRPGPGDDPFDYLAAPNDSDPVAETDTPLGSRDILGRRNFWIILGAFIPVQAVSMVFFIALGPLVARYGVTPQETGILLSIAGVAALVGKLGAGLMADRYGNRTPTVLLALLALAGIVLLSIETANFAALSLAVILGGMSGGIWTMAGSLLASEFGPHSFGRAYGLLVTATPVGSFMPVLVQKIFEMTGSYVPGLAAVGLLCVLGLFSAMMLPRQKHLSATASR